MFGESLVTGMKIIKNPDKPTKSEENEIHFNARAKNCLFESFSMDVFNQVFTLNTAHEIWLKLSVSKNIV